MKNKLTLSVEDLIALFPAHIYWKDKEGIYRGCNKKQAYSLGCHSPEEVIGKTDFELPWPKEVAQRFRDNDLEVMNTQRVKTVEENAIVDGKPAVVLSQKIPLYDSEKNVAGILGISIDITEHKRAEAEANRLKLEANSKFNKVARQVAHDIRSPLSSLMIVVKKL